MAGERDWREAFWQAKSYGMRLGAQVIVTAAAEGVRIYRRSKDDFDFAQCDRQPWSALAEGETLRHLGRLLRAATPWLSACREVHQPAVRHLRSF